MTKIGGVWVRRASKNTCDNLHISATVEASNFKFSTQLGFGEYRIPRNNLRRTKVGGGLG